MRPVSLSRANFPTLPAGFETPLFDSRQVSPGIVHLGLGGFHRAHMARYTHDLMGVDQGALQWGIKGAGLRPSDKGLLDVLAEQGGLYCLIEREGDQEKRAIIGSIIDAIDASASSSELLMAIDEAETRIVSMTVTENGYHLDQATKALNFDSPEIQADLADPEHSRTVPGILVEAYRRRRRLGLPAFTALCCDNIQHNGKVLKALVLAFADRVDPDLARWIEANASFPNSMVDRITPVPTEEEAVAFRVATGIDDRAVLHTEMFRQWVVEDDFVMGRPEWETVGVQFVDDVTPYEFMKLRLLNASHLAIAAIGQLCGYELIGDAVGDPLISRYMVALMDRETGPTLMPVPGVDLPSYKRALIARFSNPAIKDTTQRVNTDAPINYLLEPIRDRLERDQPIDLLALGMAAWCRRLSGRDDRGIPIAVVHPLADLLASRARAGGRDPTAVLTIDALFGSMGKDPRLVTAVEGWLVQIYENGMRPTMEVAAERCVF